MAFELKKNEPLRKAVCRLACRRAGKAIRALKRCDRMAAVHAARKEIKQLRAFLRLLRPVLTRSDYRRSAKHLRKAARLLAPCRDAYVKVNALKKLVPTGRRHSLTHPFPELHRILAAACQNEQRTLLRKKVPRAVRRALRKAARELASAPVKSSAWSALAPGLRQTYRDGRRRFHLAQATGRAEDLHAWRKRVKDLLYQTALLCPLCPRKMRALEARLQRLSDCLGVHHDLFVLAESGTATGIRPTAANEAARLRGMIMPRQQALARRALKLGNTLFRTGRNPWPEKR